MGNVAVAIALSLAAGLSTAAGGLPFFLREGRDKRFVGSAFAFSGGVMLAVSLFDILPHAAQGIKRELPGISGGLMAALATAIGMLTAALLERVVPKYIYKMSADISSKNNTVITTSVVSIAAIILHNFPEGIATFMAGYKDVSLGASVALAIALHNLPEGISVAVPVYCATKSKRKAFLSALVSGVSEPLGAISAYLFLSPYITNLMLLMIFAFVSGIMIYISASQLIPSAVGFCDVKRTAIGMIAGIATMLFQIIIF